MYYVEKTFRVPIGHRLSKHEGLCKFPHGHNFCVVITLKSDRLNYNDMVMDFSILKDMVNTLILNEFDHGLMLNKNDKTFSEEQLKSFRYIPIDGDPTAEKLSEFIFKKLDDNLKNLVVSVSSVKVWENEDSCAIYTEE